MLKYQACRNNFPTFSYHNFTFNFSENKLKLSFHFSIGDQYHFHPTSTLIFNKNLKENSYQPQIIEKLVFNIGLMEAISYWKTSTSPKFIIDKGFLSLKNQHWWSDLIYQGLGEFRYQNNIDINQDEFLQFKCNNQEKHSKIKIKNHHIKKAHLIPIGGGKDSSLTLGLLAKNNIPHDCLVFMPDNFPHKEILKSSQHQDIIFIQRKIHPLLIKLNQEGFLNGHVPFSAYLAFYSTLAAYLNHNQDIILSNEASANYGNVVFRGQTINHQYSKSLEFENKFRGYINRNFPTITHQYYSLLRPLYEIQIAGLFSDYPQYHDKFISCNRGLKARKWCHQCSKCLFTHIMLSPFISPEVLNTKIFNHNLLDSESLLPLALELIGLKKHKPFECVGTPLEVKIALQLITDLYQKKNIDLPIIIKKTQAQIDNVSNSIIRKTLKSWFDQHNLPPKMKNLVKTELTHNPQINQILQNLT